MAAEESIRFDGRVAIVTGAGGGLGRAYALALAGRGASVVVNDLGGGVDGAGQGAAAADRVVDEIVKAGGKAVASYDSVSTVEGGESMVRTALGQFGKLDILIHNAGIVRDRSFGKMTPEDWDTVLKVHLYGAYNVSRPAFATMRENKFGRIVLTTSSAGLFGNFGQSNYAAAKLGMIGLMNVLKIEGAKSDIKVNAVAPFAATRMSAAAMPDEFRPLMRIDMVAPMTLFLCSAGCPVTGNIYEAGMGHFNRVAIVSAPVVWVGDGERMPTVEDVAGHWPQIDSLAGAVPHFDVSEVAIPRPRS